jgi:hypothetical protein
MGETSVKNMPRGGANQSFIFRRAIYAMQAHLKGRKLASLREAEDFNVPRTTGQHATTSKPAAATSSAASAKSPLPVRPASITISSTIPVAA